MARVQAQLPGAVRAIRIAAAPALFLAVLSCPPDAPADEAQDLKAAIVVRCIYAAGEFGSQLVDSCVNEDLAAAQALQQYPREFGAAIGLCTDRLQGDGWGRIKACADENIAAEAALESLDPRHAPLLAECRAKAGKLGAAKVKGCVDEGVKSGSGN